MSGYDQGTGNYALTERQGVREPQETKRCIGLLFVPPHANPLVQAKRSRPPQTIEDRNRHAQRKEEIAHAIPCALPRPTLNRLRAAPQPHAHPRSGFGSRGTDHCTCKIKWSYGRPCSFFIAASASDLSSNEMNPNPLHRPVSGSLPT